MILFSIRVFPHVFDSLKVITLKNPNYRNIEPTKGVESYIPQVWVGKWRKIEKRSYCAEKKLREIESVWVVLFVGIINRVDGVLEK